MPALSGPFVVLGGGPCGLAAAAELAERGHRPFVLEREAIVGGLCATHEYEGWRFDLGGHRFVSSDAALSQKLERLLGSDLLAPERRSVVLHDGRRFRYPLEARDLVANLGVRENVRALAGYARARIDARFHPCEERTFEDWVVARFGRPLYETFFGPYTRKLWGIDPRLISADWAAERISLLHLGDAALRLVGLRRDVPARTYARRYLYPRLGMGQIYDRMAAEIASRGGEVRTQSRVVGFETARDRVVAVRVESPRGAERIPVGELIATVPLTDVVRWLHPGRAPLVEKATRALRFRALVFVVLCLRRRDFSENTWMYVASRDLTMSRIQEPKRRSASMAPDGRTSLLLEIPCDVGDATWRASTADLVERGQRELASLGFSVDDIIGATSVRVEHGYPVYHLGYDDDRRALLREVARFRNVRVAGRQGLFRYVFMDAAMQMGVEAARQMIAGEPGGRGIDAIGRASSLVEASALTA